MSEINEFFEKIKSLNSNIYPNSIPIDLEKIIKDQIKLLFPNLIYRHLEFINELTKYLLYQISNRFIQQTDNIIGQYTQNNYRDVKAIILMLLPFIDDKNNNSKFKKIENLNQIIYNKIGEDEIKEYILNKPLSETLKSEFLISNFGIGLLNKNTKKLLDLKPNNEELILKIIYNNFIGLLETLKIINGKLYINWINVEPILESNYINEDIYKNTFKNNVLNKYISNYASNILKINFELEYNGLWLGDFYNTYRKGYYQSIKKIKWLIYNNKDTNGENKYYIQILDKMFGLETITIQEFKNFNSIPSIEQLKFIEKYELFILELKENNFIMARDILIFLVNNYSYREVLKKENDLEKFVLNNLEDDEIDEDLGKKDLEKINNLTSDEITEGLNIIGPQHFWTFLYESIDNFKSTIYSTFLLNEDNSINQEYFYIKLQENKITTGINLKNLYNLSKLLSHLYDNTNSNLWRLLSDDYRSLGNRNKYIFLEKLIEDDTSWIRIRDSTQEMLNDWNKYKFDFSFIYLIRKGILSKFKVDLDITNKNNLPSKLGERNKKISKLLSEKFNKNKKWEECYYFLTNQKYSKLDKMRTENKITKIKEMSFFDFTVKEMNWYLYYALDWLTQISFYHTYNYHQILYITGATGQGKSTQVPKLLLFALKMIDYNEQGKIVCTQPRIPPTVNNAERISTELGVPIKQPSYSSDIKVNTNNYYVQYKYQGDSHISTTNKNSVLKIVTDGTLFSELKSNLLMKEKIPTKNKKEFKYSDKNYYDIIIVDEAHEHGKNMDLILTMARNSCYYNNSIKLIIVSATMDDDEPIYRSYFNQINDNIIYPIKQPIINPFVLSDSNVNVFLPQTLYMDRRFHISPPGETTQYKIEENYLNLEETGSNENNSKTAQLKSYNKVIEICNQSVSGEILLFSTGQKEILEAVEYLNKKLPKGNIALPYFGTMNERYKNIIEKINKNIGKIRNSRERIHLEWGFDYVEDKSVPEGIYKRSVIVATNVAEASVTIPGLKYVIDNGYAKEANFNEDTQTSKLDVEMISESSRIQRKGRVGRIADGFVYYMYQKNARLNIKPKYKINQQKMSDIFTQLSSLYNDKNELILPYQYDPHLDGWHNLRRKVIEKETLTELEENSLKFNNDSFFIRSGIKNIIDKQFYITVIYDYLSLYFPEHFISNKQELHYNCFNDGFLLRILFDEFGKFYLIHPVENKITRNCLGHLIKFKYNDNTIENIKILDLSPYFKMISNLSIRLQIVNISGREFEMKDKISNIQFNKTLFCEKLDELKVKLTNVIDIEEDILTLIYSQGSDVLDEVIMIISILKACNYSVKRLAKYKTIKGKEVPDFENLKNIFHSDNSDIDSLFRITQLIKNMFSHLIIFNLKNKINFYQKFEKQYEKIVEKYSSFIKSKGDKFILDPPLFLKDEWNLLNKLNNEGKLGTKIGFLKWLSLSNIVKKYVDDDLQKNKIKISQFCNSHYLNFNVVIQFLKNYFMISNEIFTLNKNEDDNLIEKNPLDWVLRYKSNFNKLNIDSNIKTKVIQSFVFGYSTNSVIKFNQYQEFTVISSILKKISIEKLFPGSQNFESFLTSTNSSLIFINLSNKNNMRIIINIKPNELIKANPLYFNRVFFKNLVKSWNIEMKLNRIIENHGDFLNNFLDATNNNDISKIVVFQDNSKIDDNFDVNMNKFIKSMINRL